MPNTIPRGFHSGELAVQRRAGTASEAARLEGMLGPVRLTGGVAKFLARREFAVLTARDRTGRLWTSPLLGPPGFLDTDTDTRSGTGTGTGIRTGPGIGTRTDTGVGTSPGTGTATGSDTGLGASARSGLGAGAVATTLVVHAVPADGDPLRDLPAGQAVGMIAVEFAIRRRLRVNGTLIAAGRHGLSIDVDQAYGNCPSYIQQRELVRTGAPARPGGDPVYTDALTTEQEHLITSADTFFLGTAHPTRGSDSSHRGGLPGFVRVDGPDLWWPDYPGNNMFNSLGNIAINPEAALLFIDFTTGDTIHLSGTAELQWTDPGAAGDEGDTGRRVRFHPEHVLSTTGLPVQAGDTEPSPHNPRLR